MPLFDLECQACNHRWEHMVRDGQLPPCPECAATDVIKLPTIGAIAKPKFVPTPGTSVEFNMGPREKGGKRKVDGLIIKKT